MYSCQLQRTQKEGSQPPNLISHYLNCSIVKLIFDSPVLCRLNCRFVPASPSSLHRRKSFLHRVSPLVAFSHASRIRPVWCENLDPFHRDCELLLHDLRFHRNRAFLRHPHGFRALRSPCPEKDTCNSRIIKVKLTIIFSITRQAAECAIIDFFEDTSDEVFHSTKDTAPLRFGAIAEILLLITHKLFKQPQESRDDFHL